MGRLMLFRESTDDDDPVTRDYAQVWRSADKVVYSRTLDAVRSERSRLEPTFEPAAVRRLVDEAATDVSIGGATLAGHALRAGLVDQLDLFVNPVVVGGGTRWLPDGVRLDLALTHEHRFAGGVVHPRYEPAVPRGRARSSPQRSRHDPGPGIPTSRPLGQGDSATWNAGQRTRRAPDAG